MKFGVSWEELEPAWKGMELSSPMMVNGFQGKLDYNEINQIIFGEEDAESHHDSQAA